MRIFSSRRLWPEVLLVPTLVALISSLVAPTTLAATAAPAGTNAPAQSAGTAGSGSATPAAVIQVGTKAYPVELASLPALASQGVILSAPKTAVAGQPFSVDLIVRSDQKISGYETQLLLDT